MSYGLVFQRKPPLALHRLVEARTTSRSCRGARGGSVVKEVPSTSGSRVARHLQFLGDGSPEGEALDTPSLETEAAPGSGESTRTGRRRKKERCL